MRLPWEAVMGYPVACSKADWHRKAGLEGSVSTSILWARNSGEEQEKPQASSRTLNDTFIHHPRRLQSPEELRALCYKDAKEVSPSPAIKASTFHQPPWGNESFPERLLLHSGGLLLLDLTVQVSICKIRMYKKSL